MTRRLLYLILYSKGQSMSKQYIKYLGRKYLNLNFVDDPVGPLVDEFIQDIGAEDFNPGVDFIAEVVVEGNGVCNYTTARGRIDQERTGLSAGDRIGGVCGVPTRLRIIRGSSTITRIRIGIIA